MATETAKTTVSTILLSDVKQTYRGKTGCACGCGGNYFYLDKEEHQSEVLKHFNHILRAIEKGTAEFFGNGVEVANEAYTRVTRVYFKDGIYYKNNFLGMTRQEKADA